MASPAMQLEKRGPTGETKPIPAGAAALWIRTQGVWATMSGRQRNGAIATFLLLAGLLAGLSWYALRTDWRILYSGLDTEDARQVGLTLTQAQIPFDLADNGMTLRVPSVQLDKARLATSAKAIRSGRMGFELFDKPNWVGSEFDEQVNYQRALEGELEHTVSSLSDVETARVHLVMPHDSLFREQQRPAKASVVLKLRRASLAEGEADSIRNLVASAVDALSPDHVVLVDASGRLSLGPKTEDALRLSGEQALEQKLVSTLEAVTGPGNVRASVTIDYDPDSREETSESYDPAQTATLSMERTEQTSGGQPVAAGVPGTASNAPNSQSLPVYPKQTTAPQSSKSESGTYGVSKTVRHKMENPGKVRRLTAAVIVNDRQTALPSKGQAAQWQPRSAEELSNLTLLAQAAVGSDAARGDLITVQGMSFEQNRSEKAPSVSGQLLSRIQMWPEAIKYFSLLLGLVIVMTFGVRPALRQATSGTKLKGALTAGGPGEGQTALPQLMEPVIADSSRIRAQQVFDKVSSQMKNEPTQSSRLLQSWIHSD
jgi:flagellar M-ring protein FliF